MTCFILFIIKFCWRSFFFFVSSSFYVLFFYIYLTPILTLYRYFIHLNYMEWWLLLFYFINKLNYICGPILFCAFYFWFILFDSPISYAVDSFIYLFLFHVRNYYSAFIFAFTFLFFPFRDNQFSLSTRFWWLLMLAWNSSWHNVHSTLSGFCDRIWSKTFCT